MLIFFIFLLTILLTLIQGAVFFPLPFTDSGNVRYRTVPIMTLMLILINSLVFLFFQAPNLYQGVMLAESGDMTGLDRLYSYVVTNWTYGYRGVFMREGLSIGAFTTFTSMFMHGDMWHLLGNMIFLWSFGRRVEDACGPWRFLLFYLAAGMVANLGSEILNPSMVDLPGIGASGAISGVMGAYLVLFPSSMVTCIWVIGVILRFPIVVVLKLFGVEWVQNAPNWRWTIRLPGWLLLIYFLIKDTIPSLTVIQQGQDYGGVNNLAHLTGFLAALFIFLFVRKDLLTRYVQGRKL